MKSRKIRMKIWTLLLYCMISFITTNSYATRDLQLRDLFVEENPYLSTVMSSGGQLTITGSGTIRFLQAFFYSNVACTTLLGAASIIDNVTGKTFTTGQTVSINSSSVYQLANNQGIATNNIACMKVFLNGSNQSSKGISCQSFSDMQCSGVTCTSSQTKSVSWASTPSFCATQYAYISNFGNSTVSQCTVDSSTGALTGCGTTGSGFSSNIGVSLSNYYSFVDNNTATTSVRCRVSSSTGALSTCTNTGSGLSSPQGNTLNNAYFYAVNSANSTVSKCTVSSSTGDLSSCNTTGSGFNSPRAIVINNGFAYIANGSGTVSKCTVDSTSGALSSCVSTGSGFGNPNGIVINNGFAYIANVSGSTVSKCTVDGTTGLLSSCATTGSGFANPRGMNINNNFIYVTNSGTNNSVSTCTINTVTGALTGCGTTSGFTDPRGIFIF